MKHISLENRGVLDRLLFDIDSSNLSMTLKQLNNSAYVNHESKIPDLVSSIFQKIILRVKKIDLYAIVINWFAVASPDYMFKDKFKKILLDKAFEQPYIGFIFHKIPVFAAIRRCIELKTFNKEEIRLRTLKDFGFNSKFSLLKALYFLPEIENPQCQDILSNFVSIAFNGSLLGAKFLESKISNMVENDYKILLECIHKGTFYNEIAQSIKHDDINQLIHLTNNTEFDVNGKIQDNLFEHGLFCHGNPSLISYSCFYGSLRCFKFLLLNNADLNTCDEESGFYPEHYAIMGGDAEIIHIITQRRFESKYTLQCAALYFREDVFEWLLNTKKVSIDSKSDFLGTVLHISASVNNFHTLQHSLSLGNLINESGPDSMTPLMLAIALGSTESEMLLLCNEKIDVNKRNKFKQTALHVAAITGDNFIIKRMRKLSNADPNVSDTSGWTPLHYAVSNGFVKCVKALLKFNDIDLQAKTHIGETAMSIALQRGDMDVINIFMQLFAFDASDATNSGVSELHIACANGLTDIVKLFLNSGCNVNIPNNMNQTPIFECVNHGHPDILKLLLKCKDIDIHQKDSFDQTIFTMPKIVKNEEVNQILQNLSEK